MLSPLFCIDTDKLRISFIIRNFFIWWSGELATLPFSLVSLAATIALSFSPMLLCSLKILSTLLSLTLLLVLWQSLLGSPLLPGNSTLDLVTRVFTWPHRRRPFTFFISPCPRFGHGFCQLLWHPLVPYRLFYLWCGEREFHQASSCLTWQHPWVTSFCFGTVCDGCV